MLESISQELPEDVRASLVSISGLDILYAPIRHALRKLRSRPAIEKKRADVEHAVNGAHSQTESHRDTLASLQASCDLKIAKKSALETELRSLSADIEADKKKIAELPGLIEKTQAEAKSAIAKMEQCDAELTTLSSAQKDCHELLDNFRQATSNARGVIAKHLNALIDV
jgi:chromosome segregation ATPase